MRAYLALFTSMGLLLGAAELRAQEAADPGAGAAPEAAAPASPAGRRAGKRQPKAPAAKPTRAGALLIDNQRDATLVELTAAPKGRAGEPQVLAQGIEPGGTARAQLAKKSGCVFDVTGSFNDESTIEAPNVNLCKDGRITLSP